MNFILCNTTYADTGGQSGGSSAQEAQKEDGLLSQGSPSQDSASGLMEDGEVSGPSGEKHEADSGMGGSSILGSVLGFLAFMTDIIPLQLQVMLSLITFSTTSEPVTCVDDYMQQFWISVDRIVFNKISLSLFSFLFISSDSFIIFFNLEISFSITFSPSIGSMFSSNEHTNSISFCEFEGIFISYLPGTTKFSSGNSPLFSSSI